MPKKIKRKKIERSEYVHFSSKKLDPKVLRKTGEKIVVNEAKEGSFFTQISYKTGAGKNKVISKIPSWMNSAFLDTNDAIIKGFDVVFAIDTNDYLHKGRRLSVGCSFYCKIKEEDKKKTKLSTTFVPLPITIISNVRRGVNSEVISWYMLFNHIFPLLKLDKRCKLLVITDTELDKHEELNQKSLPYYFGQFLPENVFLAYASDEKMETNANRLIKFCDKTSRNIFAMIESGDIVIPNDLNGENRDFDGYALIHHSEK